MIITRLFVLFTALSVFSGCVTNPVTGKNEVSFMSPAQELEVGRQNYGPYQQQQGGEYVTDPQLTKYVSSVGQKLAAVSDRKDLPYEFVVLNNDVPNAWALPGGKIAINRGLLVQLEDESQLAAVLGHEIVHAAARHGANQQTKQKLLGVGVGIAALAGTQTDHGVLIAGGAMLGSSLIQAQYGQGQELESDYYGMQYMARAGYEPMGAVELQELFVKMSAGNKSSWTQGLFASHPPSQARVDKNKATAATLPKGVRNKAQFQAAMKQVLDDADAYAEYSAAMKKVSEEDLKGASALLDKAIALQPKESLFYVTKGQLAMNEGNVEQANKSFAKAAKLNPNYYAGQLGLGITQYAKNDLSGAQASLNKSVQLMPSLPGVYYLGETYFALGKKEEAKQYLSQAAGSQSEMGKAAQKRLTELQ